MKQRISLSIVFFIFGISANAQVLACKKFRNGTFKMTYEGKKGIIKRYNDVQEEYMNGSGKPTMTFTVKWISDCIYTLTPTATTRKEYPDIPKDGTMTVKITETTANSYNYSATYSWNKQHVYRNTLTLIK